MPVTASAHLVIALAEAVERAGVSRKEYLERGTVPEERLADQMARFDFTDFGRLQMLALDLSGDPALGLHLAEHASEAAFDLVGHLTSQAATFREALRVVSQYGAIVLSDFVLELSERVDVATLRYDFRRSSPLADRMHAEFAMAGFLRLLRRFASPDALPHAVYFEHAAPAHRDEYARVFLGKEHFGRPFTAIVFPRAWLDQRKLHQNERLAALLREEARRTLDAMGRSESHTDRITRLLHARPAFRTPSMHDAARHLGISVRSLRRRLSEEGVSYRGLVASVLANAAKEVLQDGQASVDDAARATGYSETTAFHRAFKRWTGVTPKEFRRTAQ